MTSQPATPYRLTCLPAHVVTKVTRQVRLRCDDNALVASKIEKVNRIRMLKKSSAGWILVAELRDNEDKPLKTMNVTVLARIDQNVRNTSLEIIWEVASKDTYGTYICEVVGFEKDTQSSVTELTSQVTILEEAVTTRDLLDLFQDLKRELSGYDDKTEKRVLGHDAEIASMKKQINALYFRAEDTTQNVTFLSDHVEELENQTDTVGETARSLTEDVLQLEKQMTIVNTSIDSTNNTTRLLRHDMTDMRNGFKKFREDMKTLHKVDDSFTREIDTLEGKLGKLSRNMLSQSDVQKTVDARLTSRRLGTFDKFLENFAQLSTWPRGKYALPSSNGCPLDRAFFGNSHMFLDTPTNSGGRNHKFLCESTRVVRSNRRWPEGHYCVNKVIGIWCPDGLEKGQVDLSSARSKVRKGASTSTKLEFCCKRSGSLDVAMEMPTHSRFALYRRGGRCQKVKGMRTSKKYMDVPSTLVSGVIPDYDVSSGRMRFCICHYY
ncbi:apextrin [Elysia marginata]|uniref:Apextrin n=1 Tax=Elysia marginata TaxID=1093978 RepID=A0AAV4FNA0_9GAST|nr:apextrin [Elysia marginata]